MRRWKEKALRMRQLDRPEYFWAAARQATRFRATMAVEVRVLISTIIAVVKWEKSGLREGPQLNPASFREPRFR
jgi:hypothetical protein